jgi:hypothetical protein
MNKNVSAAVQQRRFVRRRVDEARPIILMICSGGRARLETTTTIDLIYLKNTAMASKSKTIETGVLVTRINLKSEPETVQKAFAFCGNIARLSLRE